MQFQVVMMIRLIGSLINFLYFFIKGFFAEIVFEVIVIAEILFL